MKKIVVSLFAVALAIACLINPNPARASDAPWDGANIHINWAAEPPVVTLMLNDQTDLRTGTQVQVQGGGETGWFVYLDADLSPQVEAINIESLFVVRGVRRMEFPAHINYAVITFPYRNRGAAGARFYAAEMAAEGCEGAGCEEYRTWKKGRDTAVAAAVPPPPATPTPPVVATSAPTTSPASGEEAKNDDIDLDEPVSAPAAKVTVADDIKSPKAAKATKKEPKPKKEKTDDAALRHVEAELSRVAKELSVANGKVTELQKEVTRLSGVIATKDAEIATFRAAKTPTPTAPPVAVAEVAPPPPPATVTTAPTPTAPPVAVIVAEPEVAPPVVAATTTTSPSQGEEAQATESEPTPPPTAAVAVVEVTDDWGAAHLARMRALLKEAEVGVEPY